MLGILLLCVICAVPIFGLSQEPQYKNYNTTNGLPSNQVYDLFQDENGYLWIASDRGITRYDGYNFESFDEGDGLTGNTIFLFYPQKNGEIFCSTYRNQWFSFNPKDYQFKPFRYNEALKKSTQYGISFDFYIDDKGSFHSSYLFLSGVLSIDVNGTVMNPPGVSKLVPNDSIFLIQEYTDDEDFYYSSTIRDENTFIPEARKVTMGLCTDSLLYSKMLRVENTFIFSNGKRLYLLDENAHVLNSVSVDNDILSLGRFDEHHFWVGTKEGGALIFDLDGKRTGRFLNGKSVTCCYFDHEGGQWFGTLFSGLFYHKPDQVKRYELPDNHIRWLTRSAVGSFFVSTTYSRVYEKEGSRFKMRLNEEDGGMAVGVFYEEIGNDLFFVKEGIRLKGKQRLIDTYIVSLSESTHQPFLCASVKYFCFFSGDSLVEVRPKSRINTVTWGEGGVYVGMNEGVAFYDTLDRSLTPLNYPELGARIQDIKVNGSVVLVGTLGRGLMMIEDERLTVLDKSKGLSSNLVNQIEIENDSIVWVATNSGLNRLTVSGESIKIDVIDSDDGLIDNNINDLLLLDDTMWVATGTGLLCLPTSLVQRREVGHFFLQWKHPILDGRKKLSLDLLDLSYDENNLEFSFHSVCFTQSTPLKYRYKLSGFESQWHYTQERRFLYSSLPPGEFTLIVQSSTDGKNWEKNQLVQKISIAPPFYKTRLFIVIVIVLSILLVYSFFRFRILTYNREIIQELLRQLLKRVKKKTTYFIVRCNGKDIKINSSDVLFVQASGNYIELHTLNGKYLIREKISNFIELTPDPIEYIRVSRSCVVRIDKIQEKGKDMVMINDMEIKVGVTYLPLLSHLYDFKK